MTIPFSIGNVAIENSRLECMAYHFDPICIVVCNVCIVYVHHTTLGMFRACIHVGVHDHLVPSNTCCESLDIAYQCVASERMKTSSAKKLAIVMATSKQYLTNYLLNSP